MDTHESSNDVVHIMREKLPSSNDYISSYSNEIPDKNTLRNIIESDSNNDLLSNLDSIDDDTNISSREVEEATVDPLILLYRKIANKRRNNSLGNKQDETEATRKRKGRRNQNNVQIDEDILDDSDLSIEIELQDGNSGKSPKHITISDSRDSNDLYAATFDESDDYDKLEDSNVDQNHLSSNQTRSKAVSQELPEGYPTDRLNQEEFEPSTRSVFLATTVSSF